MTMLVSLEQQKESSKLIGKECDNGKRKKKH